LALRRIPEKTMPKDTGKDMLALLDEAKLSGRFWTTIGLLMLATVIDSFDAFLAAFLVSVLAPQWQLTFLQTSIILLSGGIGTIVSAPFWGSLCDVFGRKPILILGTFLCALSAGAAAFLPERAWALFALQRFFVGVGLAGAAIAATALLVEFTPTRYRTMLTSAAAVPVGVGLLLASVAAATLLQLIGWRGLAALGFSPIAVGILLWLFIPESIRWLVARGRLGEARSAVARRLNRPAAAIPLAVPRLQAPSRGRLSELAAEQRRIWLTILVWLGASTAATSVLVWGPTIIVALLGTTPQYAARLFIYVSLAGIGGRIMFSLLPQWLGRRRCGELMGYGAAVTLAAAAIFHADFVGSVPLFIVFLVVGALFFEGGFANLGPYAAEIFPVRLAARGVGLAQAANGVGRIAGPLCLGLISGSNNFVTPQATADAVLPVFLFLAGCSLVVGMTFTAIATETHGRPLSLSDDTAAATTGIEREGAPAVRSTG
jgi:MFS transporter, putative metabolite:H+ symporter